MTATDLPLAPVAPGRPRLRAALGDSPALRFVGPNWFAVVMGTGIVPLALVGLPVRIPWAVPVATVVWLLAAGLLVVVAAATALHHHLHPEVARGHRDDPVLMHFYGAPAMALMTVGAGALLLGRPLLGPHGALAVAVVLWGVGTALGLVTTVLVPYRLVTRHSVRPDAAFGGWLMPVVPPMVSAATGALLVPHLPADQPRATLLAACCALFGLALSASSVVIALLCHRLVRHGVGPAALVPTLWIVLGPLGQSVTAAHHLGAAAPSTLDAPYGEALDALAPAYGLPAWGAAIGWLVVAASLTVRTARTRGLPFGLPWWSFTFPLGTVVTGTSALADDTGLVVLRVAAVVLFALLVAAWGTVLTLTARGVFDGRLLGAPRPV